MAFITGHAAPSPCQTPTVHMPGIGLLDATGRSAPGAARATQPQDNPSWAMEGRAGGTASPRWARAGFCSGKHAPTQALSLSYTWSRNMTSMLRLPSTHNREWSSMKCIAIPTNFQAVGARLKMVNGGGGANLDTKQAALKNAKSYGHGASESVAQASVLRKD